MKLPRRKLLGLAAGVAALPILSRLAGAQSYPSRPVRIVAAFAAGGGVDITARLIAQWLSDRLGQSFVVENRPGAGGNIGTETVINAPPDGQILLLATVPNAVNSVMRRNLIKLGEDGFKNVVKDAQEPESRYCANTGALHRGSGAFSGGNRADNPEKAAQAKAKPTMLGWFVGQAMKASGGKANPQTVNALLKAKLGID